MITDKDARKNGQWRWANPWRKFVLSPEVLGDEWTECERCFYRRVRHGIPRPMAQGADISSTCLEMMNQFFSGKTTDVMGPEVPVGIYYSTGHEYQSMPQVIQGHKWHLVLKGCMNGCIACEDGTYVVSLMRAGTPPPEDVPVLWRQLMAYARCLDNSIVNNRDGERVQRLGLLIFEPHKFVMRPHDGRVINSFVAGELQWIEVERDDKAFDRFVSEVLDVLECPELPEPGLNCEYCRFIDAACRRGV